MFFFKMKTTTAIYCPYCHSPMVEHGTPVVSNDLIAHYEVYGVSCQKCGAGGFIHEIWPKPKTDDAGGGLNGEDNN